MELIDWEEKFKSHIEETKRLEKETEDRIERSEKREQSWQLLRECTRFLRENEKGWKEENERNCKVAKNTRLRKAEKQKLETLKNLQQKKITESWKRLPEHERRRLEKEETRRRKLELRDAKINIWKKWRKKENPKKTEPGARTEEETSRAWLDKIEETLEKIRQEEESRKEARLIDEQRRNTLLVFEDGELGQVGQVVHHLRLGLGERQRVVQGDSWYTKKTEISDLYISSNGVPIRQHFNNIYNFSSKIFTKQFNPNPLSKSLCKSRHST